MKKLVKKDPIFFNQAPITQVETLESITHLGKFLTKNESLSRYKDIEFKSTKKEYLLSIDDGDYNLLENRKGLKNIFYTSGGINLKVDIFFSRFTQGSLIGNIYNFKSIDFTKKAKKYFKLIIPVDDTNYDFLFQLCEFGYYIENYNRSSFNATSIKINDENFYIFNEKRNQKKYLIIHSDKKQFYDDFSIACNCILICLGYITGKYIANRGYYFAYNNKKMDIFSSFYFRTLRNEIKNFWQPINSNAYSWVNSRDKKRAEKISKNFKLRNLTKDEFAKLCQLCIEDDNFLSVLFLIIEANDTSLVFRPGGYSIALETLSSIISRKSKVRQNPITSKKDCEMFQNELYNVIDKYKDFDSFKDIETLKGKIEHINQMTNKEKLLAPFKELGIVISDADLEVIKSRNDFLHGRVPNFRGLAKNRTIEEKDADLYYASTKLYTLLNLLILKYIGYDNYVLNFSKLHEQKTKYPIKEDYYRK